MSNEGVTPKLHQYLVKVERRRVQVQTTLVLALATSEESARTVVKEGLTPLEGRFYLAESINAAHWTDNTNGMFEYAVSEIQQIRGKAENGDWTTDLTESISLLESIHNRVVGAGSLGDSWKHNEDFRTKINLVMMELADSDKELRESLINVVRTPMQKFTSPTNWRLWLLDRVKIIKKRVQVVQAVKSLKSSTNEGLRAAEEALARIQTSGFAEKKQLTLLLENSIQPAVIGQEMQFAVNKLLVEIVNDKPSDTLIEKAKALLKVVKDYLNHQLQGAEDTVRLQLRPKYSGSCDEMIALIDDLMGVPAPRRLNFVPPLFENEENTRLLLTAITEWCKEVIEHPSSSPIRAESASMITRELASAFNASENPVSVGFLESLRKGILQLETL